MKTIWLCLGFLFSASSTVFSQAYTLWSVGNAADTLVTPFPCTLLMGGATEDDTAMKKFLQHAHGGDVVVIRTSGSDGYNNYLYSQLGVTVHSVKTLLVPSIAAANDSFVVQTVRNAEALWIAGGDQSTYVGYWKNTALNTAINHLVNVRHAPIGGTSAGMAIMGEFYYSALNGSATSAACLSNPYNVDVTIGNSDFIDNADMKDIITDTHFDNPDRRGRIMTFIARNWKDLSRKTSAIACDEYAAVMVDSNGMATAYGGAPTYDDNVYFIKIDCQGDNTIENCTAGNALNWKRDSTVAKVYKIQANHSGTQQYDLRNFLGTSNYVATGGVWEDWWVDNGSLQTKAGTALQCGSTGLISNLTSGASFNVIPNPAYSSAQVQINLPIPATIQLSLTDIQGKSTNLCTHLSLPAGISYIPIDLSSYAPGLYFVQLLENNASRIMSKLIVR